MNELQNKSYYIFVLGTPFSEKVLKNLSKRRDEMFNHDTFYAALYLAPCYNFDLTEIERENAIAHLIWLNKKLESKYNFFKQTFLIYNLYAT